jgi:protein MpaA
VRSGATKVFVGLGTGLTGPRRVVQALANHDDHMHVRIAADAAAAGGASRGLLGRSTRGRPIRYVRVGDPSSPTKVLVVGVVHGNERGGLAVTRLLERSSPSFDLWIVPSLNPDGEARGTRQNGRGVDLNRNFPSSWKPIGSRWYPQYSGPRALSERETRIAVALVLRLRPRYTLWFHEPQGVVRAWGPSVDGARRYARLAGARFRALPWPNGTAPSWQNRRFPHADAFVVELGPAPPAAADAARYARAVLALPK